MRTGIGVLLAAGGAAAIWLLKKGLHRQPPRVHRRDIVLVSKQGMCGLQAQPADVTMRRNEQLHWIIRNEGAGPCNRRVEVCIAGWHPANPMEDAGSGRFCRQVLPGHSATLPARVKQNAQEGRYRYEVWIDGRPALDPMVDIVI